MSVRKPATVVSRRLQMAMGVLILGVALYMVVRTVMALFQTDPGNGVRSVFMFPGKNISSTHNSEAAVQAYVQDGLI